MYAQATYEGVCDMKANGVLTTKELTRGALLLALTLAIQAFGFPPVVTGPLVNLMLALAVLLVGRAAGTLIGFVTPWVALAAGILPAPLAPAIPFIMLGNVVYCLLIGVFSGRGVWHVVGVAAGALVKFAVIAGAASYLLTLPGPMTKALLFPQLVNALTGGLAAVSIAYALRWAVAQKHEEEPELKEHGVA